MYPSDGTDEGRYGDGGQHGDAWPGGPAPVPEGTPQQWPQPGYVLPPTHPQEQYPPPPGYGQPGYQQPGYQQPGYQQPGYQQPTYQPAYEQPGGAPPGYQQPVGPPGAGYPQQPGYPPVPGPAAQPRSGQGLQIAVLAAVAVIGIFSVVGVALYAITRDDPAKDPTVATSGSAPAGPASPTPRRSAEVRDGLTVGSGPVRVDVYVDYQCPPCSEFEEKTATLLTDYLSSNRITLSIHPVAFIDDRSKNEYATRAAAAMVCAYEDGKLLEFHSHLLRNQPAEDTFGPTDEELVRAGTALGLGAGYEDCVSGQRRVNWVGQATSAAEDRGVSSVPAVYVNSKEIDTTRAAVEAAIDNSP